MQSRWLLGLMFAVLAVDAMADVVAVPPSANRAAPAKNQIAPALLTPSSTPPFVIALSPPSASEKASLKTGGATAGAGSATAQRQVKRGALKIGFARALPGGEHPLATAALPWQPLPDGGQAARVVVSSPGAAAIRIGVRMTTAATNVALRFAGAEERQVYGPISAREVAASNVYWSPVLDGDLATLEIYLPPGVAPSDVQLALPLISHLAFTAPGLPKSEPVDDIGTSGPCEVDVVCVGTAPALQQARAVAKMLFTESGNTFICTGTLLNDSTGSNTPYFYTASHCIDSQEAAGSLITYWFFDALTCGSLSVPPYATVNGGAMLLGRSIDADWALVRLNQPPPANAYFSAWRADLLSAGSALTVIHHPNGDLKKITEGTTLNDYTFDDGTSFAQAQYTRGSTEPGSSGSGLLTLASGGSFYELRGGLFGGDAACMNPSGTDVYSRIDVAAPLLMQYLAPSQPNPSKKTLVVEYYDPGLDDYFITAYPPEIAGLDNGAHPGWVRTGLTFLAYSDPTVAPAGVSPVCRFYVLPQFGDSHFYSADPSECAATAVKFAGSWVLESSALFYIQLPNKTTGTCPANTRPVYRFVNNANEIHHRYTAEIDARNCIYYGRNTSVDKDIDCSPFTGTWSEEGYGAPPDASVMCSPTS
jgi:lysyl endopeptidase